jgi:hypothetical protein
MECMQNGAVDLPLSRELLCAAPDQGTSVESSIREALIRLHRCSSSAK